ncbi:MAG TPA: response regulator transcription factor [Bacteroidia bacterium]|nr:response regulator transcription factor [Bacteroidia bacterium]
MHKIRIIVVDDHQFFVNGIKDFLKEFEQIECVGEAKDGRQLMELLKVTRADIVLLDFHMPVINGREALSEILKYHKDTRVIIVSFEKDPLVMKDFIMSGAHAYLTKDADPEVYSKTIFEVFRNGVYLSPELTRLFANDAIHPIAGNHQAKVSLSTKEIKILIALCGELSAKEIAGRFAIAVSTVQTHKKNLYRKTGAKNLAGLARYAMLRGFIRE